HWRALLVAFRIVLRRSHVTLGVDAVVITPVSHCSTGNTDLERLAVRQCIARHETTVAPSPNPNARAIDVRLALQPRHTIFEISQLELTEVFVDGPRRIHTFAARRAVIANPDDVTLLGQQLMEHVRLRTPAVSDLRRVWSTVSETHHRILLPRVEVRRLDHHRFHRKAVARLDLQQLRRSELVLLQGVDFVLDDHAHEFSRRVVQANLRGRVDVTPNVDEVVVCRTEIEPVRTFRLCETRQSTAVKLDAITLRCDVTMLGRGEVDVTVCFIHTFDRAHFPFAVCDLSQ